MKKILTDKKKIFPCECIKVHCVYCTRYNITESNQELLPKKGITDAETISPNLDGQIAVLQLSKANLIIVLK